MQCSSWLLDCWSTPLASIPRWSGPSAGIQTSTMLASVRLAGATCWPSSESCSPSSCPFLPNMHRRSSCPPPLYPRCYSASMWFAPPHHHLLTTLSNPGLMSDGGHPVFSGGLTLFGKAHSVKTELTLLQQTPSSCNCYVINSNSDSFKRNVFLFGF